MYETELAQWWARLSDEQRRQLKASAETGTLDGETLELLRAMTTTVGMSGLTTHGDGMGDQGPPRWSPMVREFVLAQ